MIESVAEIVFGAVFVVSGALKFRDAGWPTAARALSTPELLVPWVPIVELGLGATIIAGLVSPWTVWAGVALLVAFTIVLARAVRLPDPPVCACFGAWSARPVSGRSLVRNSALIALGVVAAVA